MSSCSVQAVATQGCDEFVHCSLPLLNKQFCLWVPPCLFVGLKFCGPSGRRRATATTKHCALQRLEASPDRAHREKDPRRALRRTAVRKFGRSLAARLCICCDSQGLRVGELVESLFVAARSIQRWPPRERSKADVNCVAGQEWAAIFLMADHRIRYAQRVTIHAFGTSFANITSDVMPLKCEL